MKNDNYGGKKKFIQRKYRSKRKSIQKSSEMDLVFGFISLFFRGLAFFQSMKTKVQVSFLKDEIQQLQKKEVQSRSELTYTPEIESFMNRFVALYMNTFDNHEQEQQRQETLKRVLCTKLYSRTRKCFRCSKINCCFVYWIKRN